MRVLVVDDEPLARRRLVRMLGEIPEVSVAGETWGSGTGRSKRNAERAAAEAALERANDADA